MSVAELTEAVGPGVGCPVGSSWVAELFVLVSKPVFH